MMTKLKTYSELMTYDSFEDRFRYLRLTGDVGVETFGYDRYINQMFYKSPEWKKIRDYIILRDEGCDLGHPDHVIFEKAIIHHINPITKSQILERDPIIFDPEFLITTIHRTHNAIHYGDESILIKDYEPRSINDTCPWKR